MATVSYGDITPLSALALLIAAIQVADSDETGRSFQSEAGHLDACSWVEVDGRIDGVGGQAGKVCGPAERRWRRLSPVSSMR